MSEARSSGGRSKGRRTPIPEIEGRGETFEQALEDAAKKAIRRSRTNDGKEYVVLYHVVTVSNPRISEHKIKLGGGT